MVNIFLLPRKNLLTPNSYIFLYYFPFSGVYQAYPYSQCSTNEDKYEGDRPDNPIFGGGGFVGEMTGEECKNMCDDPTNVDEYDRPCVAYEHSSQNASDVANCALAWACESTNTWEGGATYTTGINLTFNAYIGYYSVHIDILID